MSICVKHEYIQNIRKILGVNRSLVKKRLSQMVRYGTPTSAKRLF